MPTKGTFIVVLVLLATYCHAFHFKYQNFASTVNLNRQGPTRIPPQSLLLTEPTRDDKGSMWFQQPVDFTIPFTTKFTFSMRKLNGANGADGLAFVIQNRDNEAIGGNQADIGYGGTGPFSVGSGIAVEFDTYQNVDYFDPNNNHVSIHQANSKLNQVLSANESQTAQHFIPPFEMNLGQNVLVEISTSTNSTGWYMSITVNGHTLTPVGGAPIPQISVLLGKSTGYVGFTSSTGGEQQDHYLSSWEFYNPNSMGVCALGFKGSSCLPDNTLASTVCPGRTSCFGCTTEALPCQWNGDSTCSIQNANIDKGGIRYNLSCPTGGNTSTSYTWVWILLAVALVIIATIIALWYFKRRAARASVSGRYGYL